MNDWLNTCGMLHNRISFLLPASNRRAKMLWTVQQIQLGIHKNTRQLTKILNSLPNEVKSELSQHIIQLDYILEKRNVPTCNVDVVILTALQTPELDEVLALPVVDNKWEKFSFDGEPQNWYLGMFPKKQGNISVVAATCDHIGLPSMAVISTIAIIKFEPKFVILCGISAGMENTTQLGDVLAPRLIYVHDSGKISSDLERGINVVENDPWTVTVDSILINQLKDVFHNKINQIYSNLLNEKRNRSLKRLPKIHCGPLASGSMVINSNDVMTKIKKSSRKTIGLEMEGYSLLLAAQECHPLKTKGLVLKSVCDFGHSKSDEYQQKASSISARFAYEFLMTVP